MNVKCFDPIKNQVIKTGEVVDHAYVKKVQRSKHFLRMYNGYAIQKDIVDELQHTGINEIVIKEDDRKEIKISLEKFLHKGIRINLGHGEQIVVNEKYFTRTDTHQLYFL